jgi:hypothetical protein
VCYATTTLDVTVTDPVTPTFDPIGALCVGATPPALPAVSNNNITGTWNPATISTATAGTITYTFTPAAGQCANPVSIDVTVAAQITPVFTAIGPLCVGAAAPGLPAVSNNNITGTWNPATISTAAAGTITYTFTPDAGQCATATTTLDVTVTDPVTPTFDPIVLSALVRQLLAYLLYPITILPVHGTRLRSALPLPAPLLIHLLLLQVSVQTLYQLM